MEEHVNDYVARLRVALDALPRGTVAKLGAILFRAYRNDNQVFVVGNGGSASTASHMAADLAKNTVVSNMPRFRISSLNDNMSVVTALANDLGLEMVFSEQLRNAIRPGDVLVVLSGSGKSRNILHAMHYARERLATTIALLGFDGGDALELADLAIVVPSTDYGIIEDIHLIINHILVEYFFRSLTAMRPSSI